MLSERKEMQKERKKGNAFVHNCPITQTVSLSLFYFEYAHTRAVLRCWERAVTISLEILSSVTNDELT